LWLKRLFVSGFRGILTFSLLLKGGKLSKLSPSSLPFKGLKVDLFLLIVVFGVAIPPSVIDSYFDADLGVVAFPSSPTYLSGAFYLNYFMLGISKYSHY
jgi:hypothetical protein